MSSWNRYTLVATLNGRRARHTFYEFSDADAIGNGAMRVMRLAYNHGYRHEVWAAGSIRLLNAAGVVIKTMDRKHTEQIEPATAGTNTNSKGEQQ